MHKITLILILFIAINVNAQVPNQIGGRSNGLANSSLLLTDVWAVKNNIGALGKIDNHAVGLSYQNKFLLQEFSNQSLAIALNSKYGNFGLYYQQAGFSLYRQSVSGLGYAMKLNENVSAGVSLNYQHVKFGDIYGSKGSVSASIGMHYALNKNIELAMNVANLNRAKLDDYQDERFPTVFNLGMKYKFSETTFWSVEAEKDLLHPINIKSGLEIKAHEILMIRLGVNSYPFQAGMGVGLVLKKFQLDISSSWHAHLGMNPSAGLTYKF